MSIQFPEIRDATECILQRVKAASAQAGRPPGEVRLMAVTKTVDVGRIREALLSGIDLIGENRVQEAESKHAAIAAEFPDVAWHLIGNLQANKARKAMAVFDAIETIDSPGLGERLNRIAGETGRNLPVMIEVNLGLEDSKAGVSETEALKLIELCSGLPNLKLEGLMAVPPYQEDPEVVRPYFRRLRELRNKAIASGAAGESFAGLSMGMSHDFEVAIEEGATIVRVGTLLFGARNYAQTD